MKGKRGRARGHKKQKAMIPIVPGTAMLLTRMSSKDQEENGHGSENQLTAGEEYMKRRGLRLVVPPVQLVESAFDEDNRAQFDEFMDTAERLGVENLLFGRVDRSLRNLFDLYRIDKAARSGRVIHYFQENFIYDKNSVAGDYLRFGVQGITAVGESRFNSERTRRVLKARARAGYWPQKASFGYMNVGETSKDKRVVPDPNESHWYVRIKRLSAAAQHSLDTIISKLKAEGCTLPLTRNLIERVIRNPFGAGRYQWDGEWITEVKHPPLISWELHLAAVAGLERLNKPKYRQHDWPYAGLIQCALCGRAVVFETKKKKLKDGGVSQHVYAHCAGIRSAPDRLCPKCENIYLKLPEIEAELENVIRPISMKPEIVTYLLDKIAAGASEEALATQTELATLRRELAKAQTLIDNALVLHLKSPELLSEDALKAKTNEWRSQQAVLKERITAMETSGPDSYLALARKVLEPTISLWDKYKSMSPHKRASILRITCSNLKQDQKKIVPTYRTIYGFLVRGNDSGNWLRD